MKLKQIKIVEQNGWFDIRRIQIKKYEQIRESMEVTCGMQLPIKSKLKGFGIAKDLRISLSDICFTIDFEKGGWIQYEFKRGFITDLATVPWFFRSIIDNDDLSFLAAAYIHDANFSCHFLDFETTNKLFHSILLWAGVPRWRARLAYWAVKSPIGKRRWVELQKKRDEWTKQTVNFESSWPDRVKINLD